MYMHGSTPTKQVSPLAPTTSVVTSGVVGPKTGTPNGGSFVDTLQSLVQPALQVIGAGLQLQSQRDLANLNMQRLQQGLPALNYDQVPGIVPTFQVQGSVDQGTQSTMLWLAAGGAALILFLSMRGSGSARRRTARA